MQKRTKMKDPNPELSRRDKIAIEAGNIIGRFLEGYCSRYVPSDEILSDQMFDEAIGRIKNKTFEDEYDVLKRKYHRMTIYLKALLKTLKNKVDLSNPEIQKEIKSNLEEILAREESPTFEVKEPKKDVEPKFESFFKTKSRKTKFNAL
jgi:hypothetical protein